MSAALALEDAMLRLWFSVPAVAAGLLVVAPQVAHSQDAITIVRDGIEVAHIPSGAIEFNNNTKELSITNVNTGKGFKFTLSPDVQRALKHLDERTRGKLHVERVGK